MEKLYRYNVKMKVAHDAKNIYHLTNHIEKGLFLDCGSNLGQGMTYFEKFYPLADYDYILFEPNPHCLEYLNNYIKDFELKGNIEVIQKAVSTTDGETKFFGLVEYENDSTFQGASILKEHNQLFYTPDDHEAITVETFSFTEFIRRKSEEYEVIIVKMDIEGAEYDVLEDLINSNLHEKISVIYIEFHSQYMSGIDKSSYEKREKYIVNRLKKSNINFRLWV